jgi:hypothetical protein
MHSSFRHRWFIFQKMFLILEVMFAALGAVHVCYSDILTHVPHALELYRRNNNIAVRILDIIHRPVFCLKRDGDCILSLSSGGTYSVGPNS